MRGNLEKAKKEKPIGKKETAIATKQKDGEHMKMTHPIRRTKHLLYILASYILQIEERGGD